MTYANLDNPNDPHLHWNMGKASARPVQICANINTKSFGDFASSLLYVNTIAEHFDYRHVSMIYKDDMDFKKEMLRLLPIDTIVTIPAGGMLPSLELFNESTPVVDENLRNWYKAGLNRADLFITERMAINPMLWTFDNLAYLRIPDDVVPACTDALLARGLKPDRWFCTLHCREPGYLAKPEGRNFRDCSPETFLAATVHIIKKLGGQVVRMGHPQMTPFPAMEGLIDLSTEEHNSFLQIFAVSRSRFMLCGDSGPTAVADALHVPLALTNSVSYWYNNDREVVRTVDLITPDGQVINQRALADKGMHKLHLMRALKSGEGYRVMQNGPDEVIRLTNFIYDATADVTAWRTPDPPRTGARPNRLVWPSEPKMRGRFLPMPPAEG